MTRSKTNKVTVLEQIAVVVGVRGSKSGTRRAHQLSQRARGKPIDVQTRLKVATLLLLGEKSYRQISSDTGVALGSITNIKQRLEAHQAAIVAAARHSRRGDALPSQLALRHTLSDRPRIGGAAKRKIGASPEHARFVADLYAREPRLYLRGIKESVAPTFFWLNQKKFAKEKVSFWVAARRCAGPA
jgi:hypothetical protein